MNAKVKEIKHDFTGTILPSKFNGEAGREFEREFARKIIATSNSKGVDVPAWNLELKTRDLESTSPQTVGAMQPDDIVSTPFPNSAIAEKIKQQFRVKTKNNTIVNARVYDFDQPHIQKLLEEAYETARSKIALDDTPDYVYGTKFGYFERTNKKSNSYMFRISAGAYDILERMASSTFNNLFEEQ
jgi:small nuclear ribonucleoprotein (snRNP)-like protein